MKKFIVLFVSLFVITSCDDDLLTPFTPGVLDEELATKTLADLDRLLNSSMNIMTNRSEYVFTSVFTDESVPGFTNGGQGIGGSDAFYLFFLNPSSSTPAAIWSSNYNAIARLNIVLRRLESYEPTPAELNTYNRIKAQALTLRAFGHLKIQAYFSTDLSNPSALGGIISNKVFEYTDTPPRSANAEVFSFIHTDLDDAISLFTSIPAINSNINATVNLARALKARAYLYQEDYPNAESFANQVINTSGIQIALPNQLAAVFHTHTSPVNTEVIFKLRRTVQQNAQGTNLFNGWVSIRNSRSGSPFFEVSRSLYNLLSSTGDARTNIVVRPGGDALGSLIDPNYSTSADVRNTDILVPFKHGGATAVSATNQFNPDFIQVRISEMHFIVAECRAQANDFIGVRNALQNVAARRYVPVQTLMVPNNSVNAYRLILTEKRKEFAFEGHRFIDLKRLYAKADLNFFDRDPADYAPTGLNFPGADPINFEFQNNYKWALPIPINEINANSAVIQNPQY